MGQRTYTMDAELILAVAGTTIAADDVPQDGGEDIIRDLGVGRFEGVVVVDVSAIEIASNDEYYRLIVQGSSSASFASDIQNLAELTLGATEVRPGSAIDSVAGRYEIPFCNEQADIRYRYLRLYVDVGGAIATGITLGAFVAEKY